MGLLLVRSKRFKPGSALFPNTRAIVTDHGSHFKNKMMAELSVKLGFHHNNSTPYYPQANGQVEAINKVLKKCFSGW